MGGAVPNRRRRNRRNRICVKVFALYDLWGDPGEPYFVGQSECLKSIGGLLLVYDVGSWPFSDMARCPSAMRTKAEGHLPPAGWKALTPSSGVRMEYFTESLRLAGLPE